MLKEDCGGQKEVCEQVEALEEVVGRLDADVDFLVWQLRPTALDDLGLQDALTNFAQNWSKHFRIPAEVLTRGLRKEASTSEIDTTLYRIAQEALNNVAKHARASSVTVLLEGRADAVSLIIEDDGVGFDAEHTSGANGKGLGLVGMRERAALVGGTAEVESQPGEGTRVIVRIPTPPPAQKGEADE
jgi:signal transduction histidine kinase